MPLADFAAAYEKIKQAGSVIGPVIASEAKQSISPRGRMDCFVASLRVAAGRDNAAGGGCFAQAQEVSTSG